MDSYLLILSTILTKPFCVVSLRMYFYVDYRTKVQLLAMQMYSFILSYQQTKREAHVISARARSYLAEIHRARGSQSAKQTRFSFSLTNKSRAG